MLHFHVSSPLCSHSAPILPPNNNYRNLNSKKKKKKSGRKGMKIVAVMMMAWWHDLPSTINGPTSLALSLNQPTLQPAKHQRAGHIPSHPGVIEECIAKCLSSLCAWVRFLPWFSMRGPLWHPPFLTFFFLCYILPSILFPSSLQHLTFDIFIFFFSDPTNESVPSFCSILVTKLSTIPSLTSQPSFHATPIPSFTLSPSSQSRITPFPFRWYIREIHRKKFVRHQSSTTLFGEYLVWMKERGNEGTRGETTQRTSNRETIT
jgi:hypothetical protein